MTRPIDEKIVAMKLDNSDFAKKAAETTGIFGKLRNALNRIPGVNLGKTTEELGAIRKEVDNTNLSRLSDSLQMVTSRFSTLGVVGTTALVNIANRAVDAGLALGKNLTLDQVISGFNEYELKIGSIRTILANTEWAGTGLEDVKGALEELNQYADQTIYNFGQMTENIGRFTAAGVKIDDATIAIKGLSNLAAVSGSDVNQLNTAMYQMSQAMAAGKMNLMDWNSLVNAGMGGKKLQDELLATAKAMGVNVDLSEGFRNSISDGWLTSEVFLETLKKFGKDESMIEAATKVRTFSQMMDTVQESIGSGWAMTFEHIFGDFEEATKLWSGLADSVTGWVGKNTDARNSFMEGIANQGGFLNVFEGIQNAVKPIMQIFGAIKVGFREMFPRPTVLQVVALTESFKEFTAGLTLSGGTVRKVATIFKGVFSVFSTLFEIVKQLGSAFLQIIPEGTGGAILDVLENIAEMAIKFNQSVKEGNALTGVIDGLGAALGTIGTWIGQAVSSLGEFGKALRENLGNAVDWIRDKLAPIGQFLKETFGGFGGDEILGTGMLVGIFAIVTKIVGFFNNASDIVENVSEMFEGVGDAIQGFAIGIKVANLVMIAVAIGILAASLKTLEGIKTGDMIRGITALATSLGIMIAGMTVIDKLGVTGGLRASVTLIALAAAVSIMASALKKVSDLGTDELIRGIGGLVGVTVALSAAVIAISSLGGKIGAGSLQLIALATAVLILSSAVEKMSSIKTSNLMKSIAALGVIFAQIAIFLKVVDGSKLSLRSALGVVAISGAVQILVSAIDKISKIDTSSLVKGLSVIGIILAEIAIFSKVVEGGSTLGAGAGLLLIAAALNVLMGPITTMGKMSWEELAKGLGGMAVALVAVGAASKVASGSIVGAAGILIMAAALNLLMVPIKSFSKMSWGAMVKGFVGLAGGLGVIAGAALLLTPAVPSMLGFGAALALMGVAILAAGAGIGLFGIGLATLATLTAGSVAAIVSALALLLQGFASLIPAAVNFVVELGIALIDGTVRLIPSLIEAGSQLILSLLDTIAGFIPNFIDTGVEIITNFIDGIARNIPKIVDSATNLMLTWIETMAEAIRTNGPQLVDAVLELMGSILLVVVDAGVTMVTALFGWIPGVKDAAAEIGSTAEQYIRDNFGAQSAGVDKGVEFASGVYSTTGNASIAGLNIAEAAKNATGNIDATPTGEDFGQGFAEGIRSKLKVVAMAAEGIAKAAYNRIKEWLDINSPSVKAMKLGSDTGTGFKEGIHSMEKPVTKASEEVGKSTVAGYSKGIESSKRKAAKSAKSAADVAKDAFKKAIDDAEYKFKMEEIDGDGYVAELKKIKNEYSKYPELVKEANLEIKKAEEDVAKHREDLRKKEFDNSKQWIDDRKYYNELSLTEELRAWERVQARYDKGTEQRKQADREVYRVKNEINKQLIAINDEYVEKVKEANKELIESERELNEEYEKALVDRKNVLTGFAGLFDEVNTTTDTSGWQLLENLRSQVDTFISWSSNLDLLAGKGIDSGLLDELTQMGPRAAGEIAALNSLTEEQLNEYTTLWRTKNELAHNQAVEELEGLKADTNQKIIELREQTSIQLSEYEKEWVNKIKEIKVGVKDQYVGLNDDMKDIGKNTISGLMNGLASMEPALMAQAQRIASAIRATIQSALAINSPSRVTTELGEYTGEGLVVGIANKVKDVVAVSKRLALAAKDSLTQFLEGFEIPDGDDELHFKAIIDYDKIDPEKFGKLDTLKIVPDTSYTRNNIKATKDTNSETKGDVTNDNSRNFNPVTNIYSGPSGREIARENERTLRKLANEFGV